MTTLTEDDIRIYDTIFGDEVLGIDIKHKQEKFDLLKQQILQALQENPKLKEENQELLIENNQLSNEIQENYVVFDEVKKLKAEIEELNKMLDDAHVLRGKDAEKFEEYNNRKPTQKEIELAKEAYRVYAMHDPDKIKMRELQQENESLRQLKKRVEEQLEECIIRSESITTEESQKNGFCSIVLQQLLKEGDR